jgi:Spy/CpxP family protein refolding chaperone
LVNWKKKDSYEPPGFAFKTSHEVGWSSCTTATGRASVGVFQSCGGFSEPNAIRLALARAQAVRLGIRLPVFGRHMWWCRHPGQPDPCARTRSGFTFGPEFPGKQPPSMKAFKHWKVLLALVLVFAAGTVTGSVLTVVHFKRAFEKGLTVENWTNEGMKFMQKNLNLTPEQQPRIRAILEDTGHQFKGTFGQAIRESGTNLVTCWQRIDRELTPEQRVIHQRKCEEFRQGVKKALNVDLPASSVSN